MAEQQDSYTPPKINFWTKLRYMFVAYFFMGLSRVLLFLIDVIAGLFMPVAVLFELIVVIPLSKFSFSLKDQPAYKEVQQTELPDKVWRYFEESQVRFSREGFVTGRFVSNENMFPDQKLYAMIMINREEGIGVGFIYIDIVKAKDDSVDISACEFTCIKDGMFYDVTNNTQTEPFLPMNERQRIILDNYPDEKLLHIFRKIQEKMNCRSNDKMLELLESNPRLIMNDEIKMFTAANLKRGYMFKDEKHNIYRLTWKGAWLATFQSLWPLSSLYRKRLAKMAKQFLQELDIDADKIAWQQDEEDSYFKLDEKITSINKAISVAHPFAQKAGFDVQPVSISATVTYQKGNTVIDNLEVRYEDNKDYPEKQMYWQTSYVLFLDNIELEGSELERDDVMMSYQELDEYEIERTNKQPLPEMLSVLNDFNILIANTCKALARELENEEQMIFTLEMGEASPVWKVCDYTEEGELCVTINASNGELISKNLENSEY